MDWVIINDEGEIEFVSQEVKLVPEVQALLTLNYNKEKGDIDGRKRIRAKQEIKYLFLAYSPKSPYRDYNERERIEEARLDCKFPVEWYPSPELKALIPKFVRGTKSRVIRLLETVTGFLDKFESHLNSIILDERNASGGLVYKATDIMATLERLPRLAETLQELEQQAKVGVIAKHSSKGDHELGWMAVNKKQTKKHGTGNNSKSTEEDQGEF